MLAYRISSFCCQPLSPDLDCEAPSIIIIVDFSFVGESKKYTKVKTVTLEEVNKTSIYDVVYPLPGHAIEYPQNEIAEWYKEVLREYEISDLGGKQKYVVCAHECL